MLKTVLTTRAEQYIKACLEKNLTQIRTIEEALRNVFRSITTILEKFDYYEHFYSLTGIFHNDITLIDCLLYTDDIPFLFEIVKIVTNILGRANLSQIPFKTLEKFSFFCKSLIRPYKNSFSNLAELLDERPYFSDLVLKGKQYKSEKFQQLVTPSKIFSDEVSMILFYNEEDLANEDKIMLKSEGIDIKSLSKDFPDPDEPSYNIFDKILNQKAIPWPPKTPKASAQVSNMDFYQLLVEIKIRRALKKALAYSPQERQRIIDYYIFLITYLFECDLNFGNKKLNSGESANSNPAFSTYTFIRNYHLTHLTDEAYLWDQVWALMIPRSKYIYNPDVIINATEAKDIKIYLELLQSLDKASYEQTSALFRLLLNIRETLQVGNPLIGIIDEAVNKALTIYISQAPGPALRGN
jgi:hypothetical protein